MSDYGDRPKSPGRSIHPTELDGQIGDEGSPSLRRSTHRTMKDAARPADAAPSAQPSHADRKALAAVHGEGALQEARRAPELRKVPKPSHEVAERMRALQDATAEPDEIGRIAKQLQEQQRSIGASRAPEPELHAPPPIRHPNIPPNAVDETDDRLERMERRFERMLDAAANGAEVATGLQEQAVEVLARFEAAASDNDRSATRAIRLAAIAVVIAAAMPVAQVLYAELWRVPRDTASMEAVIADMRAEIATLRQAQLEAADRLAAALERSDQQGAEAPRGFAQPVDPPPPALVEERPPAE